jgi:RNA polymerase sigma-70 factor (ECF subfamily)
MEDEEILRLLHCIEHRDEAAFQKLYKAFSKKLFAYAVWQLDDATKAEEIVSDTLFEIWQHPTRFRGDAKFSTWLIGIARNKMKMAWRINIDTKHIHDDEIINGIIDPTPPLIHNIEDSQRQEGVRLCMSKLSYNHRECLYLGYYEDLKFSDIAKLLECPENTVKTRMSNARKKIENCLRLWIQQEGGPDLRNDHAY